MSNLLIPGINIPKIVSPNKWSGGLRSTINSLGRDLTQTPMGGTVLSVGTDLLGNMLSGGNSTGIGNFMQGAGGIVGTVNPVAGAVVSGVGSLINGVFGSNINEDFVNQTRDRIDRQLAYTSNALDFTGLMNDWNSFTDIDNVTKDQVGSDGLFSNKASRTTNALNKDIDNANFSAWNNISKLANDINTNSYLNNLAHFSAYGGPINMRYTGMMSPFGNQFGDGGGIYIKPSKRGTFTAAAKKHGKSVLAFTSQVLANKENYSPAMVKKANFARNATKFKHSEGGPLNPYSAESLVDAIYSTSKGELFLGKPSHNYDFTISEEEANKLGYYPDKRGHRDDRVKKPTHPTHSSRGKWNSFEEFELTDKGMETPNYTLFGLNDGEQDPQAIITYKGGIVLPEITATPKESYIVNPYDNIKIFDKGGYLTKWKHEDGGPIETLLSNASKGRENYSNSLKALRDRHRSRGNFGGGLFGGGGAQHLYTEEPEYIEKKDTIWLPITETFNDAFSRARKQGLSEFEFNNRKYTTEMGNNPNNTAAGNARVQVLGLFPWERKKVEKKEKKDFALGGELTHGGTFSNGITSIGNGGTHEQNPNDGVLVGTDQLGIPNLVEEGELIWDDYVFSNRIKVPKAVRQKYKLRDNITYAEAAKKLLKESEERPNDPISKNGLVAFMEELRNNQEEQRIKKEEKNNKYSKGGPLFNISLPEFPVLPDLPVYPELSDTSTQTGTPVKGIKLNPLRYAPIIGSAISVVNDVTGGNNPDYTNTDLFRNAIRTANRQVGYKPIGQYLRYEPLDTDYYASRLDSSTSSGRRAIQNTAGGNRAAALAGILGSDYNYIASLGQLARQAEEYNQAQKQRVAEFNRATDQYNSDLGTRVDMFNTENAIKQALMYNSLATMRQSIYDRNRAERIANLTNFILGLGDYGRESTDRDTLRWLADLGVVKYDTKGRYTGGK